MFYKFTKKLLNTGKNERYQQFVKKYFPYFLIAPTILILLFVVVFPLIYSLSLSFTNYNLATGVLRFIGIKNYLKVWTNERFVNSLFVTMIYILVVVPSEFLIGLGLALLLNKLPRGRRRVYISIFLLSTMTTRVVMGFMWKYMFHSDVGIVNYFLTFMGFKARPWLSLPSTALFTLASWDIWAWTPFMTLILLSGLVSLPSILYEAASIDGASSLKMFRWITLPLLKPVILVAVILRLVDALRTFDLIRVTTVGGPGESTELISFYTYKVAFDFFQMGYAMAISWVLLFITIFLAQIFIKAMGKIAYT